MCDYEIYVRAQRHHGDPKMLCLFQEVGENLSDSEINNLHLLTPNRSGREGVFCWAGKICWNIRFL